MVETIGDGELERRKHTLGIDGSGHFVTRATRATPRRSMQVWGHGMWTQDDLACVIVVERLASGGVSPVSTTLSNV